jgi:predicted TIM-barrel fold metal-dependent hydrolase
MTSPTSPPHATFSKECRRIDVHHHHAPPEFVAEIVARNTGQHALVEWTSQKSIDEMDAASVTVALTSVAPPGVWFGDDVAAARLARACNEHAAGLVRDHPGRFGMFAALPLPNIEASLREIEYAFDVLAADGVGLLTSYGNRWLGDPIFAPVMDELSRRKAIVYTHPTVCPACSGLMPGIPDHLIEFATDTTRTIASLLLNGTAARCKDIHYIFSHAGGTMPYLVERMTWWAEVRKDLVDQMPRGPVHELQRFFYDTAFSANRYALASLLQLVPITQVLYGTDFPFRTCTENVAGLEEFGFGAADLEAICRENALRILPQFGRAPGLMAAAT